MVPSMALSPDTIDALDQALKAVIAECGDSPEYADLIDNLQGAEQALQHVDAGAEHGDHGDAHDDGDGADAESPAEDMSADDMFAHAEAKHKERRKAAKGENPFAKGDA